MFRINTKALAIAAGLFELAMLTLAINEAGFSLGLTVAVLSAIAVGLSEEFLTSSKPKTIANIIEVVGIFGGLILYALSFRGSPDAVRIYVFLGLILIAHATLMSIIIRRNLDSLKKPSATAADNDNDNDNDDIHEKEEEDDD